MVRKIRSACGIICLILITLLFLDSAGTLHDWFGWPAEVQFPPAIPALNIEVVALLIILTAVFRRAYCSVIRPFGVFQDVAAWVRKRQKELPYSYSPAFSSLHHGTLAVFIITLIAGVSFIATLFTPHSVYGRITNSLLQPIWLWGNNLFARLAERFDNYASYDAEAWAKSLPTFTIATAISIILILLVWRNGRTYCDAICPMGTILGFLSRYSLSRVTIDMDRCNGCGLCVRHCKMVCINSKEHTIDYSRCVVCMDCLGKCKQETLSYQLRTSKTGSLQVKQNAPLTSSG